MCIFLFWEIKTNQIIMQTCSQENSRFKINLEVVFEVSNKLMNGNIKGRDRNLFKAKLEKKS